MGLFRTVRTKLPCARCRRVRPVDVQFKTGTDGMEVYDVGDVAPADDDLPQVTIWPGTVDRFCHTCRGDHRRATREAQHEVLAGLIEQGRLRLTVGSTGVWLAADAVRRLGRPSSKDTPDTGRPTNPVNVPWQYVAEWDGVVLSPREYGPWLKYVDRVRRATDERLRASGWADGDSDLRRDVRVSVAADRQIDVILVDT